MTKVGSNSPVPFSLRVDSPNSEASMNHAGWRLICCVPIIIPSPIVLEVRLPEVQIQA